MEESKTCQDCKEVKVLSGFPKDGMGGYRHRCKPCYRAHRKERAANPKRKPPEYFDFPLDVKVRNYHNVINRLTRLGIMSEGYAEKARARVDAL